MKLTRSRAGQIVSSILTLLAIAALLAIIFLPTPERNTVGMKTLSPHHFATAIFAKAEEGADDHVRNLIIYPVDSAPDGRLLQFASGELYVARSNGGGYEPFVLCAELPFHYRVVHMVRDEATSTKDVFHLVHKDIKSSAPTLDAFVAGDIKYPGGFKYAWWASRKLVHGLWVFVISIAAIGVVRATWKAMIYLRQPRGATTQAAPQFASAGGQREGAPASATSPTSAEEAPLFSSTAPVDAPVLSEPTEEKEYEGEFYPVAHPRIDDP
jgi:hypothetical protein